jgi:hypothetical protein
VGRKVRDPVRSHRRTSRARPKAIGVRGAVCSPRGERAAQTQTEGRDGQDGNAASRGEGEPFVARSGLESRIRHVVLLGSNRLWNRVAPLEATVRQVE